MRLALLTWQVNFGAFRKAKMPLLPEFGLDLRTLAESATDPLEGPQREAEPTFCKNNEMKNVSVHWFSARLCEGKHASSSLREVTALATICS